MILTKINQGFQEYYIDEHDRLQGKYTVFHENGHIKREITFLNNVANGECRRYNDRGELTHKCLYINSVIHPTPIENISEEDKLMLTIKHNLRWLD